MQKLLRIFLVLATISPASVWAQGASAAKSTKSAKSTATHAAPKAAQGARSSGSADIGEVIVDGPNTIPLSITGAPELVSAANQAFRAHGRYRLDPTRAQFELRFSNAGPSQVRVDVLKGGQAVLSQTLGGTSTRNALFRAADVAVKATSGLPGFFASKLAFVSERSGKSEIMVSDLFMDEARQVTHDNAHALTPRWSPDGTKLLYTSFYKSGYPDIFLIDLASQQRTTFLSLKGTNTGARFSPNGSQVVMVLSGEGNSEIYVSNSQGRGISRRTRTPDSVESSPCFSPDGGQIVYASGETSPQLYVMPAGGGAPRRLAGGFAKYCAEPDWSRGDPSKIAFTMGEGRNFQVAVLDLNTGAAKRVSKASFDGVEPCWLADGRHLVYTARSANSRVLCILDTETMKSTRISGTSAGKASVWYP